MIFDPLNERLDRMDFNFAKMKDESRDRFDRLDSKTHAIGTMPRYPTMPDPVYGIDSNSVSRPSLRELSRRY